MTDAAMRSNVRFYESPGCRTTELKPLSDKTVLACMSKLAIVEDA